MFNTFREEFGHGTARRSIACAASLVVAAVACGQSTEPAVFVVNNVSDEITTFTMNEDGTLNFVGKYPTSDGPTAAAITPNGKYLAVTHGTADDYNEWLYIFEVRADASLEFVHDTQVPDSPLATKWLSNEILSVIKTDLSGPNELRTYRFDPESPDIAFVDAGATGSFSSSITKHPKLPVIYAQDSTYNKITAFEYDEDGYLTDIGQMYTGGIYPLDLVVSNGGWFLYAGGGISGGGHAVIGCRVDGEGVLSLLEGSPFYSPGQSPAYTAISEDDSLLFVGHGSDATLRSFLIDDGGEISPTGYMFDIGMQGTLGDIQILGDYLLVTDESTAIDGIAGIYSFFIKPSGILVAVDDIYLTDGVRPEAIVVWEPSVAGDATGDGIVDVLDLLMVLTDWGMADSLADLNQDGVVDVLDLILVLSNWT